jgi:hypothetical protein
MTSLTVTNLAYQRHIIQNRLPGRQQLDDGSYNDAIGVHEGLPVADAERLRKFACDSVQQLASVK